MAVNMIFTTLERYTVTTDLSNLFTVIATLGLTYLVCMITLVFTVIKIQLFKNAFEFKCILKQICRVFTCRERADFLALVCNVYVMLSLSHWYPESGVVLDCIDS